MTISFWCSPKILIAVHGLLLMTILLGCAPASNEYVEEAPPEVTVVHPIQQTITQFIEENGTTEAFGEADVRARVRGFIEEIVFQPGQEVKAGDVLYRIEQDQYEAELNSAKASVASADAAIKVAEAAVKSSEAEVVRLSREFERMKELIRTNAVSQAEYDRVASSYTSALARVGSSQAQVDAANSEKGRAEAMLAQAQLNFNYTVVRAPIAGEITRSFVKEGNLVENGDLLTTITDDNTVFINFNITDRDLLRFQAARRAKAAQGESTTERPLSEVPVYLSRDIDPGFPLQGNLESVDQRGIDSRTGTLAIRATYQNSDHQLVPGLFVRVRVPTLEGEVLLIPQQATARDQLGTFVLTVNQQNKVDRRSIVVDRKLDGWIMVGGGLTPDDRVVLEGIQRARPEAVVAPEEIPLSVSNLALIRGLPEEQAATESPPSAEDETPAAIPSE